MLAYIHILILRSRQRCTHLNNTTIRCYTRTVQQTEGHRCDDIRKQGRSVWKTDCYGRGAHVPQAVTIQELIPAQLHVQTANDPQDGLQYNDGLARAVAAIGSTSRWSLPRLRKEANAWMRCLPLTILARAEVRGNGRCDTLHNHSAADRVHPAGDSIRVHRLTEA